MLFYNVLFSSKGLEKSWERHQEVAEYFHAGLENMGLKLFVKEKVSFEFLYKHVLYLLLWDLVAIETRKIIINETRWKCTNSDFNGCYRKQDCQRLPQLLLLVDMTGKRSQPTS